MSSTSTPLSASTSTPLSASTSTELSNRGDLPLGEKDTYERAHTVITFTQNLSLFFHVIRPRPKVKIFLRNRSRHCLSSRVQ